MTAVDTNILIYAWDPGDPAKYSIANNLVNSIVDGVLVWQVAVEFLSASRKLASIGFDLSAAFAELRDMRTIWSTSMPSMNVLNRAEDLINRFSLSTWDALVIAASLEAGATRLYSEDFDAYTNIDGMEIVNPFATP